MRIRKALRCLQPSSSSSDGDKGEDLPARDILAAPQDVDNSQRPGAVREFRLIRPLVPQPVTYAVTSA